MACNIWIESEKRSVPIFEDSDYEELIEQYIGKEALNYLHNNYTANEDMDDLLDSEREKAQEDGYNKGYDDRADEEIMNG